MSTTFNPAHSQEFQRAASPLWFASGVRQARNFLITLFSAPAPRVLTRQQEAEQVRNMAVNLAATDPSFADDLFAAADRHEEQ